MKPYQLAFRNRFWRLTVLLSRKAGVDRPTAEILKMAYEQAESRNKEVSV